MCSLKIGNKQVGEGAPLYFIADIAANHDGDIKRAFRLIELARESGADAAKFQNFQASKIVSRHGFEVLNGQKSHQAKWGKPVFDVYQEASVSFDWTSRLKEKCDEVGIEYFTSPYDFESVDHVDPFVQVYKIGSGDITWLEIIEYIARKGKPVIIAAGASTMEDVRRTMAVIQSLTDEVVLMQCNTNYTGSAENFEHINLNVLKIFNSEFPNVVLGLSDHTHGHATVLGAIALGARVFEKHFTDDNSRPGPDHAFAMNPVTWREMVDRANELYAALGDGVKRIEDNEKETAILQRRALRFTRNLSCGHCLEREDLFPLRPIPQDGIPPYQLESLIGKALTRAVHADDYIKRGDID